LPPRQTGERRVLFGVAVEIQAFVGQIADARGETEAR
jgi:hypothetical protein